MNRNPNSPIMRVHYSSHQAGYTVEYEMKIGVTKAVEYKDIEPFYYSTTRIK